MDPRSAAQLACFCGVFQAFRAPNLSDVSRFDIARSDEIEVPAAGLNPEKFLSSEVGVSWEGEHSSLSLAYFYTDIQDMIVRTPTGRIVDGSREVTRTNGGDGYMQGIELGLNVSLTDNWKLFGNLTWQDGEVQGFPTSRRVMEEEAISRLMPLTGLAGLRWESDSQRYWLEGTCRWWMMPPVSAAVTAVIRSASPLVAHLATPWRLFAVVGRQPMR
jgi:hemoglobin/transferrin/lactoferrin receptor protein